MDFDLRWPLVLLPSIVLVFVLRLINDALGAYGVTVLLPALFIIFPAITLRLRWAYLLTTAIALMQAACAPQSALLLVVIYAIGVTTLFLNRQALQRASQAQLIWVLWLTNCILWLLLTLAWGHPWLGMQAFWIRSLADLLISSLLLVPLALWFISAQRSLLRLANINITAER